LYSYPSPVQLAVALAAIVMAASASYYFIERPFLKLKNRVAQPARVFHQADSHEPVLEEINPAISTDHR
jgi:peptidoglycan/LPS O-acetylase OafA/YrhL